SSTPDARRSATGAIPHVVVTNTVLAAEVLVSLLPHARMVDPRQLPVPLDQILGAKTPAARYGAQLGDLNAVASDVVRLARLNCVHDSSGVVAKFPLGNHLHNASVARCSTGGYS